MKYLYEEKNILHALEEARFWKHQEKEHTDVILQVAPNLEQEFVQEIKNLKKELDSQHKQVTALIESSVRADDSDSSKNFLEECIAQSQIFTDLLSRILEESAELKNNQPAQVLINHIIRESNYFIGLSATIRVG